jgi:hypothetical protein
LEPELEPPESDQNFRLMMRLRNTVYLYKPEEVGHPVSLLYEDALEALAAESKVLENLEDEPPLITPVVAVIEQESEIVQSK